MKCIHFCACKDCAKRPNCQYCKECRPEKCDGFVPKDKSKQHEIIRKIEVEINSNTMEEYIRTKTDALQTIVDLGFDYDGYVDAEDLKRLIDKLVNIARIGLERK